MKKLCAFLVALTATWAMTVAAFAATYVKEDFYNFTGMNGSGSILVGFDVAAATGTVLAGFFDPPGVGGIYSLTPGETGEFSTTAPTNLTLPSNDGSFKLVFALDGLSGYPEMGYYSGLSLTTWSGYAPTGNSVSPLGVPGGVPEPATWALMFFGIGTIGANLRYHRRRHFGGVTATA